MTPFEHARKVVPIDCIGSRVFVVSIASDLLRVPLTVTPSAQRAEVVALIARQIIARQIVAALTDEDCRLAAEIDQAYLANQIWLPSQASAICREQATKHTVELHTGELHKAECRNESTKTNQT